MDCGATADYISTQRIYDFENPQVIAVQRVERDRDNFFHEPGDFWVDLTNSAYYRVDIKFSEPLEDYLWREEKITNIYFFTPYTRNGDYTIFTDYFYFNDENGTPVLAFVLC